MDETAKDAKIIRRRFGAQATTTKTEVGQDSLMLYIKLTITWLHGAMTRRNTQTETGQSRGENDAFSRENYKASATHRKKLPLYCYVDF